MEKKVTTIQTTTTSVTITGDEMEAALKAYFGFDSSASIDFDMYSTMVRNVTIKGVTTKKVK